MIEQNAFFEKYNISLEQFNSTGLIWENLVEIFEDYNNCKEALQQTAIFFFNTLMKIQNVHSVRYRIKDAEHLIEKIIRKKLKDSSLDITLENYKEKITDLIGLRALHLFKSDWELINTFLVKTYNFKETPTANYRKGDSEELINFYTEKGCKVKEHEFGYRSVHYIVETQPAKQKYFIEIQVRTIFEEAWAEIDHTIRYPYDLENPIYLQFLLILNRLSGSADEMGSFVQFLKQELDLKNQNFKIIIDEKNSIITDLEEKIKKLGLEGEETKAIQEDLEKLKQQKYISPFEELSKNQKSWHETLSKIGVGNFSIYNGMMANLNGLNNASDISRYLQTPISGLSVASGLAANLKGLNDATSIFQNLQNPGIVNTNTQLSENVKKIPSVSTKKALKQKSAKSNEEDSNT